jgi:predicted HicB family RNase H-like nuclease
MDAKLTLKLNKKVIDRAKRYAEKQGNSLSRIIENYLESITDKKSKDDAIEITPFVKI